MRRLTICLLTLSFAFAGCGDDDPPATGGGSDPTLATVCNETDGVYLDFINAMLDCLPEFELILGAFPSDAELSDACEGNFGPYVADGTIELGDSAAAAACTSYISGSDCSTLSLDAPNPCDDFIIGQQGTGEACDTDEQCAGDAYCSDSGGLTCGLCTSRKANGEVCQDDEECQGRRCGSDNLCRDFGGVGDDCTERDDCLGNLRCDENSECAVPGTPQVGDPCVDLFDCGIDGLYCDEGGTGECTAFLELGDDCAALQGLCNILEYEWCDFAGTGTCTAPVMRADGESCSAMSGQMCTAPLVCSDLFNGGTCGAPPQAGDSCTVVGGDDSCGDFLLECVTGECQYGSYTGVCPDPSAQGGN